MMKWLRNYLRKPKPKPISDQEKYITILTMNEYGEEFIRREWR